MFINSKYKIAYICGECGNGIRNMINVFSFSDNKEHIIKCPVCGSAAVTIQKTKTNSFNMLTECIYCGETHRKNISVHDIRNGSFGFIRCPISDLGTVFYGKSDKQLSEAISDVYKTMDDIARDFEYSSVPDDIMQEKSDNKSAESSIEQEMINRFNCLNREQNISCACGNTEIIISIADDNKILLRCPNCGKQKKYDITHDNLIRLINTSFVVLTD